MKRSRLISLLAPTALALLAACGVSDSTSPSARPAAKAAPSGAAFDAGANFGDREQYEHDGRIIPGSLGRAGSAPAPGDQKRLACSITAPLSGSATIGPEGGMLFVGRNVLIVPPGALTERTEISGTVAAGNEFQIDFQPHGLQFKKPAGLVLDMSSCADAPNVVYLDEQGGVLQRITAIFSTWWHIIAAPIDHFSTSAVDV
jgi:hypothetical protein